MLAERLDPTHLEVMIGFRSTFAPAIALAGLVVLSACNEDKTAMLEDDACGASGLAYLVGQPESAATGLSHDGAVRIIGPGMAVTMDHNPERLNIEIGEGGAIVRVYCG